MTGSRGIYFGKLGDVQQLQDAKWEDEGKPDQQWDERMVAPLKVPSAGIRDGQEHECGSGHWHDVVHHIHAL